MFSEGPVWSVAEQALYFSDIPGDKRFKWTASTGMELVMYPTFKANGMAFDVEGRLIVCEHVSSSISRFHADGFRETVCFHHGGVYLNSPNDLVASARDGSIYFTDPDYGRWNDWIGSERVPLLGFKGVFRVAHEGGEAQLVVDRDEFEQPNGLCFSPDESLMYVNDSPRAEIKVFDVADDGSLVNGRVLADRHRRRHDRGGLGRRDGVRRVRQRVGHRARRGVGAEPAGRADRRDRDPGGVRQPVLGRPRHAHVVPHDIDHGAHDPDAVHLGAIAALRAGRHTDMTDSERLQVLEDREEIRQIFVDYAKYLDSGDHAGYASLFASDGVLVAQLGEAVGPAAIEAILDENLGPHVTRPPARRRST